MNLIDPEYFTVTQSKLSKESGESLLAYYKKKNKYIRSNSFDIIIESEEDPKAVLRRYVSKHLAKLRERKSKVAEDILSDYWRKEYLYEPFLCTNITE